MIPIILIQRLYKRLLKFIGCGFLGEELIFVYREAETAGCKTGSGKYITKVNVYDFWLFECLIIKIKGVKI